MNTADVRRVIDVYGGSPERWPNSVRASALALCAENAELADYRANAQRLDRQLDRLEVRASFDVAALCARLPDQTPAVVASRWVISVDKLLHWCFPTDRNHWWQPASAAMLSVAFGVLLGWQGVVDLRSSEDWTTEEQYLFSRTVATLDTGEFGQ